jgi:hypothetical protein
MLTKIGRVAALTKGKTHIVVDSGQTEDPAHATPRFCYSSKYGCRKILNNGTVTLQGSSPVTTSSSCENNTVLCAFPQ